MYNKIKFQMKNFLLTLFVSTFYVITNAQCVPNPLYQDSLYNIWPDTVVNLPYCQQGSPYNAVLDIKTPTTLIEAADGDSSLTSIDTLGQTFYVGDWLVDSMVLVQAIGIPTGLSLNCNEPNCVLQGDVLTCAYLNGTTNDPPGVYPIEIIINVYTHGDITYWAGPIPITVPVTTDLYTATGAYESITGYEIVVGLTGDVQIQDSQELYLLQNRPNPSKGKTEIQFNSSTVQSIDFSIFDLMGKVVYNQQLVAKIGLNSIILNEDMQEGIYTYSINNGVALLSRRMLIMKN